MRWNKISIEKARKFLSLLCFSLCITWSKQVSSVVTKTRARTLLLDWEQSLHFLFESQKIESRGERRSREERGRKPVPRGKRTLSAQALPQFLLLFNMICIIHFFARRACLWGKKYDRSGSSFCLNYFIVLKRNWVTPLYFLLINHTIVKETPLASLSKGMRSSFAFLNKKNPQKIIYMTFMFIFLNNLYNGRF